MELHSPPNLNLPPLMYNKKSDRIVIEGDFSVENLIKSNLLLRKEFIDLLYKSLQFTEEIKTILEESKRNFEEFNGTSFEYSHISSHRYRMPIRRSMSTFKLIRQLRTATTKQRKEIEEELKKDLMKEYKRNNLRLKLKLKRISNKILGPLDIFEKKEKIKLDILTSRPAYFCKKCKSLICIDRFHSIDCVCGEKINLVSKTEDITIYVFNQNTISFIKDDLWFEHGIDYLLRKKNFQTLCGLYILGHSGVGHEIDNIAENTKESIRIFCECKTGPISVSDVFVFSGKMSDIGCSRGYFFTNSSDVKKEIKQLARSKNISIIESVLEKSENSLMKEIKE